MDSRVPFRVRIASIPINSRVVVKFPNSLQVIHATLISRSDQGCVLYTELGIRKFDFTYLEDLVPELEYFQTHA